MRKVLITDGMAGGRELLRVLLEHEGYEVFEAPNGMEAARIARAVAPDLVLLDFDPNRSDPYSAVAEMRLDPELKTLPILAVTDNTRRADRERLIEAGFSGCIAKPVMLRDLREQLSKLTSRLAG